MHLEEAAGISKYKERRKETESRIKATRENLDRVRDVRDEVDKQLEHLNRQARAAERWKALKNEQTRKEAELRALEYRGTQGPARSAKAPACPPPRSRSSASWPASVMSKRSWKACASATPVPPSI